MEARVILCPVCGTAAPLGFGPNRRPNAQCVGCGALERHRALIGVLHSMQTAARSGAVVDIAPSQATRGHIESLATASGARYLGVDFDPSADRRTVDIQASLTQLPFASSTVGLLVCLHVLEHIPDDRSAMREIHRTLNAAGIAVVQVPRRRGEPTEEDPLAPAEERIARFGQADHVRLYGDDLEARLAQAGLQVTPILISDMYSPLEIGAFGLTPDEAFWLCTKDKPVDVEQLKHESVQWAAATLQAGLASLVVERDSLREQSENQKSAGPDPAVLENQRLRRELARLAAKLERLESRRAIKAADSLGDAMRKLRRRMGRSGA